MRNRIPVGVVIGTRPEAVKLAPVVWRLRADPALTPVVISTGQHQEMLRPALDQLGVEVDRDLGAMVPGSRLCALTARLMHGFGALLTDLRPAAMVVQGDTTSALCGALAAFYERVPVAHVEAGLRSLVADDPFPEELNRRTITTTSTWHFAPTAHAAGRLRDEGVDQRSISVVGNTVIDTLLYARSSGRGRSAFSGSGRLRILVTLHRRENQGRRMRELGAAVAAISEKWDAETVLPLHRSPAVRDSLVPSLQRSRRVRLLEPLEYFDFVSTLADADLLVTDSGGAVEEAAALGIPCLVCRRTTERPEAIEAGMARLVGTDPADLVAEADALLGHRADMVVMAAAPCPFGDGHAAERVVDRMATDLLDTAGAVSPAV